MPGGRGHTVLALAAVALVLWPAAPGARRVAGAELFAAQTAPQPWPIKDFEVLNVEPAGDVGPFGSVVAVLRSLNVVDADNPLDLNVWKTAALPNAVRTAIESHLRASAEILERWGFPPPRLEPVVTRRDGRRAYRVYLVSNLFVAGESASGVYHAEHCWGGTETVIRLDAARVISTVPEVPSWVGESGLQTVGHELFHAVQFAMPFFAGCDAKPGDWITEGTARAVGWDLVRLSPNPDLFFVGNNSLWGGRNYSARLPFPFQRPHHPALLPYATSSFWRYLAEFQAARPGLGQMPGPGANPVDYSYLAEMFRRGPVERDCARAGAACAAEIRWLDALLLSLFGRPLHEMYPRFIDAAAFYGKHRSVSGGDPDESGRTWRETLFTRGCPRVLLAPSPGRRVHRDVIPQFEDVAAQCWEIWVESGDGLARPIEVRADAPPGATALADLWGGVGGLRVCPIDASQEDCPAAEAAGLEVDTETGHPQAVWILAPVPDGGDSFFLLSNVARSPAATTRMTNLPITFTLLEPHAEMSVSGAVSNNVEMTLDALTSPAGLSFSVFYDPPTAPGACHIEVQLVDEVGGRRGDSLTLYGYVAPPLRPGRYPFRGSGQFSGSNDFAATFYANQSGAGGIRDRGSFMSISGTLEFQSVSRSAVVGRFDIAMGMGHYFNVDPLFVEVAGSFALPPTFPGTSAMNRLHPDNPCLPSSPPVPDAAGSVGPPGSAAPPEAPPTAAPPSGGPGRGAGPGRGGTLPGTPTGRAAGPGRGTGPGGAGAESADRAGRGLAGPGLTLQFLGDGAGALRSAPQAVQGTGSPTQVTVSSGAFTLALALPAETFLTQCAFRQSDPAANLALVALLGLARTEGGRLVIDVADGSLRLDASSGAVQLDVGFARGTLTVRGVAPAVVGLTPDGQTSVRGQVTGGALDVTIDQQRVTCGGLMDFSFLVTGAP